MKYRIGKDIYTGENAVSMIEHNFESIAEGNIGKVDGYLLDHVWIEKVSDEEATLHIIAFSAGSRPGYDPQKDKPEEKVFCIKGDFRDDLSKPYEFELGKKDDSYKNPYSDENIENPNWVIAAAEALLDTMAFQFGINKALPAPTQRIADHFPSLKLVNAQNYARALSQELGSRAFMRSAAVAKAKNRISFLLAKFKQLDAHKIDEASEIVTYYQIRHWLGTTEKITALAYYRQKMGMTQQELADKCLISKRQIQNYESNSSPLGDAKYSFIVSLCEVLGVKPEDILNGGTARYVDAEFGG